MHSRKALMADLSDGFVALSGGCETFEEFCEILTRAHLVLRQKPQELLNIEAYYDPLLQLFDHAVVEQFVKLELRQIVLQASDHDFLLDQFHAHQTPND